MNGSAVFLLAALKMRLGLAARRCGVGAEAAGRGGAGDRRFERVPLGSFGSRTAWQQDIDFGAK